MIYQNIHNNLVNIYKTKGTENSFRNFIRCFGVDDELIQLNIYSNNEEFEIKENYRHRAERKNYVDFNSYADHNAVVYQFKSGSNSSGYLSASKTEFSESGISETFECEIITPSPAPLEIGGVSLYPYISSSVFGVQQVNYQSNGTVDEADTSFELAAASDYSNFQVFLASPVARSRSAKFVLTSSNASGIPFLTSSYIVDLYDNRKWNLAVRVTPKTRPFIDTISGSHDNTGYQIEFYGVNHDSNTVRDSFYLTGSFAGKAGENSPLDYRGEQFLKNGKRMYVGALRTNFTGTLVSGSDVKISSTRAWMGYVPNEAIDAHSIDATNKGTIHPYRSAYLF